MFEEDKTLNKLCNKHECIIYETDGHGLMELNSFPIPVPIVVHDYLDAHYDVVAKGRSHIMFRGK